MPDAEGRPRPHLYHCDVFLFDWKRASSGAKREVGTMAPLVQLGVETTRSLNVRQRLVLTPCAATRALRAQAYCNIIRLLFVARGSTEAGNGR